MTTRGFPGIQHEQMAPDWRPGTGPPVKGVAQPGGPDLAALAQQAARAGEIHRVRAQQALAGAEGGRSPGSPCRAARWSAGVDFSSRTNMGKCSTRRALLAVGERASTVLMLVRAGAARRVPTWPVAEIAGQAAHAGQLAMLPGRSERWTGMP